MIVHRIHPEYQPSQTSLPAQLAGASRVAVLLNANARRVNERVRRALSIVVPERDLFFSRTMDEARAISRIVVERAYPTVLIGGGDGSFIGFVNEIIDRHEELRRSNPFSAPPLPTFGVLKLGTGNALATLYNASSPGDGGMIDDILRVRAFELFPPRQLDLVVSEGKRVPFAGVGLDAGILNHYIEIKNSIAALPIAKRALTGGPGYAVAIATRSLPACVVRRRPIIEVRSRGRALSVAPDGSLVELPDAAGALLYRGPALMAAASTVPCYGYGLKLFPFAGVKRGLFHLRVANLPLHKALASLYPRLWQGRLFDGTIYDFLAEEVEVTADREIPFQLGGDAAGYRTRVSFSAWKSTLDMVDFSRSSESETIAAASA